MFFSIFDISLGKVVTRVQVPGARKILALDWHPSGEVIAFSAENSLIFWKWDSSRDYHTIGIRLHDQDTHIFHRMNFVQTVRCFKFDLGGAMAFLGLYDDASDLQEYGLGICTVNQGTTLHYCRFSLNSILRKLDTGGHSYIESPVCNNFLEKLQARDNRWFKDRRGGNPNTEMSTLSFPIDLLLAMELYLTNVTEGQELEYCDSFAHHEEEFTKIATEAAKSLIEEQDAQSELPNLGTQEKQQLLTFYINLLLRSYRQAREEYCGFVTTHSDRLLSGWEAERFCARFIKLSAHHNSASDNYSHAEAIFTKIMKPVDIISNPRKYSVHGYGTLETTESRKESSPSETFRQAFCQRHRYLLAVPPCNVVKDYQDSCLEGSVHLSTNAAIYGNGSIDSTSTYKGTIAYPCYHDSTRSLAQEVGLFPPSQTYISSQLLIVDSGINLAVEWIREQYRKAVGDYICSNSIDPPQRNCFNDLNDDLLPSIIRIDDGRRICEQQLTKSLSSNIRVNIEEGAPRDVACNRGTKRKLSPEEPGSSKKRGISNSKEVHSITYIGHVVVYQSFSYGSIMRILSFGSMHPFEITCIKLSPCEEYIFVGFERQSTPIVGDVIDGIVLRINDGVLCRKVFNDSTDKGSINMATFCSVPGNLLVWTSKGGSVYVVSK